MTWNNDALTELIEGIHEELKEYTMKMVDDELSETYIPSINFARPVGSSARILLYRIA